MYYRSAIELSEKLKAMGQEEIVKKAKTAAGKVEKTGALFIFPYSIDEDSIHVAYHSYKSYLSYFYDFLKSMDLEESEFSKEKISSDLYEELKKEARNKGYLHYHPRFAKKLSSSKLEEIVEVLEVPREKPYMPKHVEYPMSLRREMERIEKNKSYKTPLFYYIVSEEGSRRREAIREALIASLKKSGIISCSSYYCLSLEKDCSGYDSNWSLTDELLRRENGSLVTFSLLLSYPVISSDTEVKAFAQSMANNQGRSTIILESDIYSEGLIRAMKEKCQDFSFVLLEDPGYTKEDLRFIARKSYDEDLYIDYEYIYRQIDNYTNKYFDEVFVYDFQHDIYGYKDRKEEEDNRKFRASLLNSFYRNEDYSPMNAMKEEALSKEAKALISGILSHHEKLEESKLKGLITKPLYRESYNDWRENPYDITTEIPSLNMVFHGDRGTGKKRTAELYCKTLHHYGLIVKDSFKAITKGEIISRRQQDTIEHIRKVFEENKGGVLYIDWGERSISEEKSREEDSILSSIIRLIDETKRKQVVILSMQEKSMNEYFSNNPDMFSLFPYSLHFPALSPNDLWKYFSFVVSNDGYKLGKGLKDKVMAILEDMRKEDNFAGRISVQRLFEKGKMNMARRLSSSDFSTLPESAFTTLKSRDFDNFTALK